MDVKVPPIVIIAMAVILDKKEPLQLENCSESVGLLTTYRCNLNCTYCYIHTKRDKDMTLNMAQSILEPFLKKKEGLLNIAFMGGETLKAIDVIRPLVEWVEKNKWNRRYRFFGSTNGTLLNNDLKKWLRAHSNIFTLGLSYDGLPSAQTSNRGVKNIDIDFFIKTWHRQPIQMTINTKTVKKMADGVIYLLNKGATIHPNVAFEEEEWSNDDIIEYGRQLNKLIYYYEKHEDKPLISQFIHNLNEYADSIDNHKTQLEICGAGNGFQVFDIDGKSYPCHILSPLVLEGEKLKLIKDGLLAQTKDFSDENCYDCPYISSCPTCIACNFIYRGRLQKRDKTHCRIMKEEVRAFIKKEVMRLRKKKELTAEDATEIDSIVKLIRYNKSYNNTF